MITVMIASPHTICWLHHILNPSPAIIRMFQQTYTIFFKLWKWSKNRQEYTRNFLMKYSFWQSSSDIINGSFYFIGSRKHWVLHQPSLVRCCSSLMLWLLKYRHTESSHEGLLIQYGKVKWWVSSFYIQVCAAQT